MTFVQIIDVTTDDPEALRAADARWLTATRGRNTLRREAIYADHHTPNRYLAICEFDDHDSAMANSALPETDAVAAEIAALATGGVGFTDLDLLDVPLDHRGDVAQGFLAAVRTGRLDRSWYADDVAVELNVPFGLVRSHGTDELARLLRDAFPYGGEVVAERAVPTETGVVVEFAARTVTGPDRPESTYSRNLVWLELTAGRIRALTIYCSGDWDAATQAEQLAVAEA
ncbi:nuclear transport factor 2-like protein [Actinomycetospora sp. C-140]